MVLEIGRNSLTEYEFRQLTESEVDVIRLSNYLITRSMNRGNMLLKKELISYLYFINKELLIRYGEQGDILGDTFTYNLMNEELTVPCLDNFYPSEKNPISDIQSCVIDSDTRRRSRVRDELKMKDIILIEFVDKIISVIDEKSLDYLDMIDDFNHLLGNVDSRRLFSNFYTNNLPINFKNALSIWYSEI